MERLKRPREPEGLAMRSLNTTGPVVAGDHYCAAEAAHDGDGQGVHGQGAGAVVGLAPGTVVAGERAGGRQPARGQGGPGPFAAHRRGAIRVAGDEADAAARDGVAPARESHAGGALADGPALADKVVVECKALYGSRERALAAGLRQTAACMDRCAASEGTS